MIRVCVAGITGWVGRPVADAIDETDDLALVAGVARGASGQRIGDATVSASLADALETPFDVLVEYTSAETAKGHAIDAARAGRHVVIGSSGLTTADYDEIDAVAREHGVGVVAVGNFAMTAALLQRFAVEAAAFLPAWEIIDTASAGKRDAPSGMARELAWRLSQVRLARDGDPRRRRRSEPSTRAAPTSTARGSIPCACPATRSVSRCDSARPMSG